MSLTPSPALALTPRRGWHLHCRLRRDRAGLCRRFHHFHQFFPNHHKHSPRAWLDDVRPGTIRRQLRIGHELFCGLFGDHLDRAWRWLYPSGPGPGAQRVYQLTVENPGPGANWDPLIGDLFYSSPSGVAQVDRITWSPAIAAVPESTTWLIGVLGCWPLRLPFWSGNRVADVLDKIPIGPVSDEFGCTTTAT